MTWKIQGESLDSGAVTVIVESGSASESLGKRAQTAARLHARSRRHVLGADLGQLRLRFLFVGPSPDRYTRLKFVQDLIEALDDWTLEVPAGSEVRLAGDASKVRLSLDQRSTAHLTGVSAVALDVTATLLETVAEEGGIGGPEIALAEIGLEDLP